MTSFSNKHIFWGAVAISAILVGSLIQNIWKSGPGESEFEAIVSHDSSPNGCAADQSVSGSPSDSDPISFLESTHLLGKNILAKTFSIAVSDINGDDRDDILIGSHDEDPYLFLNTGQRFTDESTALTSTVRKSDRHGYTLADLDNDGDLDLAIAGGGSDGVGKGAPNMFFRNLLQENGVLSFRRESVAPNMALQAGRSRSFIPLASPDGKSVDLYYTTLFRDQFPNALLRNSGLEGKFEFAPDTESFLSQYLDDHGRGVLADFNNNGNDDYLAVEGNRLKIFWDPESGRGSSVLAYDVMSTVVGDFNNDALLDIFIGRFSPPTTSDHLTVSHNKLIYVVQRNAPGDTNSVLFRTQSPSLKLNLEQWIPATAGERPVGASDIFLGKNKTNPESRIFVLDKEQAEDEPQSFEASGIYIWYSALSQQWHVKWIFHEHLDRFKGIIRGAGLSGVERIGFSTDKPKEVSDTVLINQGDGRFSAQCTTLPAHGENTSGATIADFNNDGWLDIIGVRYGEQGSENRQPFVLTNVSGKSFSLSHIELREKDKLYRADLIAHGFFNDDEKPDLVITNGFGQIPGTNGPPRLLLNNSSTRHQAILINLVGTNSNKFGIGAKLTLRDANNDIIGYRVQGQNTNISQDTHWIHFGLGNFPAPYTLRVEWPDSSITNHPVDKPGKLTIKQQEDLK